MSCKEYIYSNEYLDLLIDYNYNINQVYTRFNPDCVNILSDKYAVIYKQIDNLNQLPISTFGYNSFPKLYTLQDEQAFNSIG